MIESYLREIYLTRPARDLFCKYDTNDDGELDTNCGPRPTRVTFIVPLIASCRARTEGGGMLLTPPVPRPQG